MNYILGVDMGSGAEYASETIWSLRDGKWIILSMRVWEVKS